MKILNKQQIKQADQATIKNEPVDSIDLMERAAYSCFRWLEDNISLDTDEIHVFCGVGNNGGDGLAIARMLYEEDFPTATNLVHFSENMSDNFITNYKRAEEIGIHPLSIHSKDDFPEINKGDVVIDAIFGIGLDRPATGFTKALIEHINKSGATIYAIDVPSGLYIDKATPNENAVIKAAVTLTFEAPKLAFLLPDNHKYIADFFILRIDLDPLFIDNLSVNHIFLTDKNIAPLLKKREKFSHKGSFGHALLIGGSFGKIGATVLASKAALRTGSGLVTAYIPKCGYNIMQTAIPEVMVEVDAENEIEFFNFKTKSTVIGIGMGLGTSDKTAKALGAFLKTNKTPLVLDADALNIISKNKEFLNYLPKDSILTPHPKEFERLVGKWKNDFEKLILLAEFSKKHKCIIVLKGANTIVVQGEQFYFNSTGSPALATAGTGDVLTGIITGLLAQSYSALDAAKVGVFIHGRAADLYSVKKAPSSLLASDILEYLGDVKNSIDFLKTDPIDEDLDIDFPDDFPSDDFFDDEDFEPPF